MKIEKGPAEVLRGLFSGDPDLLREALDFQNEAFRAKFGCYPWELEEVKMKYDFIEIRETNDGDLWFFIRNYRGGNGDEEPRDWWLSFEHEYAFDYQQTTPEPMVRRWKLVPVENKEVREAE
jgi:hypothetical protein